MLAACAVTVICSVIYSMTVLKAPVNSYSWYLSCHYKYC